MHLVLGGVVDKLSVLDGRPLELFEVDRKSEKGRNDNDSLETKLLSVVVLGLSSPGEEGRHILGHLGGGGRGAVLVLNNTVEQSSGHSDSSTGEVGVVVHARGELNTGGGLVGVTGKKGEDVVGTSVSGLGNERKIRGKSTLVGGSGSLLVRVGGGNVVGELTGSLSGVTLIIGLVVVLKLLGKSLGLVSSVGNTHEVSPSDSVEGVAGGADLLVHKVTSSQRTMVKGGEHAVLGPGVCRGVETVLSIGHSLGLGCVVVGGCGTGTNGGGDSEQRLSKGKCFEHLC